MTNDQLLELVARSQGRYNLHSHTQFCDGHATMEEFADAALKAGIRLYGFTPHSPVPIQSPCNMSAPDVADYFAAFNRICAAYTTECRFLAGMEIDYLGPEWGPSSAYFRNLPLDYSIGSVHFIPDQQGEEVDIDGRYPAFEQKMHQHFHDDIHYVVNTFFDRSEEMLAQGGFNILGHFDKIGHNASQFRRGIEEEAWYQRRLLRMVDAIATSGVIVEINTKALEEHGRMFPRPDLLPRLVSAGVPIVVNSDTHYPDRINSGRAEALAMLKNIQNSITNHTA